MFMLSAPQAYRLQIPLVTFCSVFVLVCKRLSPSICSTISFVPCLRKDLHSCVPALSFSQQYSIVTSYLMLVSLVLVVEGYSLHF